MLRTKHSQARRFSGTTALFATFVAFIRSCWKQNEGWLLGVSFYNRAVNYIDLWPAQLKGDLASLEILFVGLKNSGKTAAMKIFLLSNLAQQAFSQPGKMEFVRFIVDSRKIGGGDQEVVAEWDDIVRRTGCEEEKAQEVGYEIFDPVYTDAERLIVAVDVAEHLNKGPLNVYQRWALRVVLHYIRMHHEIVLSSGAIERVARTMTEADARQYEQRVDELLIRRWRRQAKTSPEIQMSLNRLLERPSTLNYDKLLEACGDISAIFMLLIDGEYGQIFAGNRYLSDALRPHAVMWDMGSMTDDQVALLEILRFRLMGFALRRGDLSVIPHFIVREEIQEVGSHLVLLRAWAFWSASARARRVCTMSSTQLIGNLEMGEPGSLARQYANQIMSGFDLFVIFTQDASDENLYALCSLIGLSEPMAMQTTQLQTGCAIIKPRNGTPFDNQFLADEIAMGLIKSRHAQQTMVAERQHLQDHPRVQAVMQTGNQEGN
ncbi:MAG: hypothetical protein WBO49_01310 [Candidatus Saccharimonas sp.]